MAGGRAERLWEPAKALLVKVNLKCKLAYAVGGERFSSCKSFISLVVYTELAELFN